MSSAKAEWHSTYSTLSKETIWLRSTCDIATALLASSGSSPGSSRVETCRKDLFEAYCELETAQHSSQGSITDIFDTECQTRPCNIWTTNDPREFLLLSLTQGGINTRTTSFARRDIGTMWLKTATLALGICPGGAHVAPRGPT